MSDLKIRRIDWNFDGVEFIWNPENPAFSVMMNSISFLVLGLEKYFCRAMKDAEAHITDPAILAEAKLFNTQEMIHSKAHYKHVKALIARYPGLKEAMDISLAGFDEIYETEDLKYHLGYAGGLEASFTPSFGLIINHRRSLFSGGDPRVAALFLWHFCEEIEHRSSAITVYNHVIGDPIYRLLNVRRFYKHSIGLGKQLRDSFLRQVPNLKEEWFDQKSAYRDLPRGDKLRTTLGILMSQWPWHDPEHATLPPYYSEWTERYNRGEDMRDLQLA